MFNSTLKLQNAASQIGGAKENGYFFCDGRRPDK